MNRLKCFFLFLKNLKFFCNIYKDGNRTIKIKVLTKKYLRNKLSNLFLKVQNSLLEI